MSKLGVGGPEIWGHVRRIAIWRWHS